MSPDYRNAGLTTGFLFGTVSIGSKCSGTQVGCLLRHEEGDDGAQHRDAGEDVERRFGTDSGADQTSADQWPEYPAQTSESGAPRDTCGPSGRRIVVGHESVDQNLSTDGSDTRDGNGGEEYGKREPECEQEQGECGQAEGGCDNPLRTGDVRDLGARSPPMMAPPLSTNRNESEPFALYPAFSMILGSQVFSP